jgi:release factor glutamine methyltransferase
METSFYDIRLLTAPGRVFGPRPATEALVDAALDLIGDRPLRVADVGTGSGAVAVALALHAPHAEIWAVDRSAAAVRLASVNARLHHVDDRVHVVQGDLLDALEGSFDVIVANLPYLPDRQRDDAAYAAEPAGAVFAPGDGLDPYRQLLREARDGKLVDGGHVLVQLHRRVLQAGRPELDELQARLGELLPAAA